MKNIQNYFSRVAQKIEPYQWEEVLSAKSLRFDTNTPPLPPASLNRFLKSMAKNCPINEYTDPAYTKLRELIAKYEKVESDMVTVINSGDEAIDVLAKTFLNQGDMFIITPPTYEMFTIQCSINRGIPLEVPLKKETFAVDAEKIITESKKPTVKLIFLVNPNNPSATITPLNTIEKIVKEANSIVVVDEVYREFYGKTAVPLLKRYENLVILRSFSKFAAIAGARVGYLLANSTLSQKFDAIRFPMGVSFLSYKLAEYILENDQVWMKKQIQMVKRERTKLSTDLQKLGFKVIPSKANFVLVNMGKKAKQISQKLKQRNIIIRDRSNKPYLKGFVRITVRSPEENKRLITTLKEIL
ncbi:histidinol-phosphate aminotransferase family protein [Candidatus Gottesmanbacteria bacterium]|nr:histidinol-phosphate aminotransferase family protein [Candidatus Gottesmanbacteria bacterium]